MEALVSSLRSAGCRRLLAGYARVSTAAQPVAVSAPNTEATRVRSEGDVSSVGSNTPRVYFVCHEEHDQVLILQGQICAPVDYVVTWKISN